MKKLSQSLSNIFGAGGTTLTGAIDSYLVKKDTESAMQLYGSRIVRVTEVGTCQRAVWCRIMKKPISIEVEPDPVEIRLLESGINAHKRLESYLDEMGLSLHKEEKTFCKGFLQGTPDRIIRWRNELVVVDFKTCSSKVLSSVRVYGPPDSYIRQINLYLYLTEASYGLLIYESRDDKEFYEVKVKKDQAVIDSCLRWVEEVQSLVERNKIPPVFEKCEADWCPFVKFCRSQEELNEGKKKRKGKPRRKR